MRRWRRTCENINHCEPLSRGYYLGHDAFMCRREIYHKDANIDKAVKPQECQRRFDKKTLRHSNDDWQQQQHNNRASWTQYPMTNRVPCVLKIKSAVHEYAIWIFLKTSREAGFHHGVCFGFKSNTKVEHFREQKDSFERLGGETNHQRQKRKLICYLPFSFESKVFKNNLNLPNFFIKITQRRVWGVQGSQV